MGEGQADTALARRGAGVQPDRAAVRRVLHAHRADALLASDAHRLGHRAVADDDAVALIGFDERRGRAGAIDRDARPCPDRPVRQAVEVVRQQRHAVRVDAPEAGLHQARGQQRRILLGHAGGGKAARGPRAQGGSGHRRGVAAGRLLAHLA
jgi:hypothetical protein